MKRPLSFFKNKKAFSFNIEIFIVFQWLENQWYMHMLWIFWYKNSKTSFHLIEADIARS